MRAGALLLSGIIACQLFALSAPARAGACRDFTGNYVADLGDGYQVTLALRSSGCTKIDAVYDYSGARFVRKIVPDGVKRTVIDDARVRSKESFRWLSPDEILSEVEVETKDDQSVTFAENRLFSDAHGNWIESESYFDATHQLSGSRITVFRRR